MFQALNFAIATARVADEQELLALCFRGSIPLEQRRVQQSNCLGVSCSPECIVGFFCLFGWFDFGLF